MGKPKKRRTIFDVIREEGHDEDFDPSLYGPPAPPVSHVPGSPEKLEELRRRVAAGEELFSPGDYNTGGSGDFTGLSGPGIRVVSNPSFRRGLSS